jgi:hypothetical protein
MNHIDENAINKRLASGSVSLKNAILLHFQVLYRLIARQVNKTLSGEIASSKSRDLMTREEMPYLIQGQTKYKDQQND